MASIDERVVAMSFQNASFEAKVAQTMATLAKLNATLAKVGSVSGLENIEKSANKVTLHAPMSALDRLRARLFGAGQGAAEGFAGIDRAASKVSLLHPINALNSLRTRLFGAGQGAAEGFSGIERASSRVSLLNPIHALDRLRARLGGIGGGAAEGFAGIERASSRVSLLNPLHALDRLRARLGGIGGGAAEGFSSIERASSRVTLAPVANAIDGINRKFSGMQVAGAAAIGGLVTAVAIKAKGLGNALSLGPITSGFQEYTTNLKSIQTILANTKQSGANLTDVNKALEELNKYSDKTIYNFGQMANSIGLFTAAGVDLKTSTASIKGIANLAALSGSSAEKATHAMTQLSQGIASGKIGLQDWQSVVSSGMGGSAFQRALATTGENMGTLNKGSVKLSGSMKNVKVDGESFRDSIRAKPGEESWLTSKVLTETLAQFTGDLSDAELKAKGFSAAQIKAIQETAKSAKEAATKVKDLGQVWDVAKEAMGTGWADSFKLIFGDFEQAKTLFTALSGAIGKVISGSADARNAVLGDWNKLGGRTAAIEGIKNVFKAIGSVLTPIKEAFRDIFPAKTGQDLYNLTVKFRDFAKSLAIAPETAKNLKRTFRGFFAVLHIGWTILKGVLGVIGDVLGVVGSGSGGFLKFTGSIGDFLVALDKAISKGKGFEGIFKAIGAVLKTPLELLKGIASAIKGLFGGGETEDGDKLSSSLDKVETALGPLGGALEVGRKALKKFFEVLKDIGNFLQPILEDVRDVFSKIGDKIMEGLEGVNYDRVMTFIQTTFLGGLAIGVKKLLGGIGIDLSGGMIDNFKSVTGTLTKTLTTIQRSVNAKTMLMIAGAVLALAAATIIFSQIDAKNLAKSMLAMSVGIGQLVGAMAILTKIGGKGAFLQIPFIAAAMVLMATALVVLAGAITILSKLSWEELVKGLAGVGGSLAAIGLAMKFMGPYLTLSTGPALLAVAFALTLVAVAMKMFGSMKWEEIAKGLVAIGGALYVIGLASIAIGPGLPAVGLGLVAVSIGLILLSGALSSFGSMDLWTMGKGLLGIGASLAVLAYAMLLMPPTIAAQAAGLLILGVALTAIGVALKVMGSMSVWEIAKGLTVLAASLLILALGLNAMITAGPGALALMGTAVALAILAPALALLGQLSLWTIVKSLIALAGIMTVLAVAGAIAAVPLLALGVAMVVLGLGTIAVGTGLYLMAKAVQLLGVEGAKNIGIILAAIVAFIALIPKMVISFLTGIVQILTSLVGLAPKIAESLVKIITTFVNALITLVPQGVRVISAFIGGMITVIDQNAGRLISAGYRLLLNFLRGLANNIGPITTAVGRIIARFLNSLAGSLPRILAAGARLLGAFLSGIVTFLPRVIAKGAQVVSTFLVGITRRLPGIIAKAGQLISTFLTALAGQIPKVMAAGVRVIISILNGIANAIPRIVRAGTRVVISLINGIAEAIPRLVDAGFKAIIRFMNGIARAIRENDDAMIKAGGNIARALGHGLWKGMSAVGGWLLDKIGRLARLLPKKIRDILGIHSPSTVFATIGQQTMLGLAKGLEAGSSSPVKTMDRTANDIIGTAQSAFSKIPNLLDGITDMEPVITPVLDLSNVESQAKKLVDLTNVTSITAAASYGQAATISEEATASQEAAAVDAEAVSKTFNYEQNNYSPESLSDIEIYRQTNNQLSQVKSALSLP